MKKTILLLILSITVATAFSQKYKTAADTVKLNKEYVDVTNDIVKLKARLEQAQSELPMLKAKAVTAHNTSKLSAQESSTQAAKAVSADLADLKEADKKASKALKDGYAAQSADEDVKDMESKIVGLNEKIAQKQKRLTELDDLKKSLTDVLKAAQ